MPTNSSAPGANGDAAKTTSSTEKATRHAGRIGGVVDRLERAYSLGVEHDLSASETAVLVYVAFRDGGNGCTASVETMRAETRVGAKSLKAARAKLADLGLISVTRRRHQTAVLRLRDSTPGVRSRDVRDRTPGVPTRQDPRGTDKNEKTNENRPARKRAVGDGEVAKIARNLTSFTGKPVSLDAIRAAVEANPTADALVVATDLIAELRDGKLRAADVKRPAGLFAHRLREAAR